MRAKQPRRIYNVALIALCLSLMSCGASQPGLFAPVSLHGTMCGKLQKQRAKEIQQERYLPNDLVLRRWPGQGKASELKERDFADRLAVGGPRGTLLIARGGTGKSKLAWSLEAQLCGRMPVVRVDLRWDVELKGGAKPGHPVLNAALHALGGRSSDPVAALRRSLAGQRWLMLLDSLDEVELARRKELVGHVNAAQKLFPKLQVIVFTRPPVFTGTYGLAHAEGLVELPQLSCKRTEQLQRKMLRTDAHRATFHGFLKRFGLDRKAQTETGRCYYTHLATYRDFFALKRLAEAESTMPSLASRTEVYERYVSVTLAKDLKGFDLSPEQALATLDAMIAAQKPDAGARNLRLRMADCERHLKVDEAATRKSICERLMQSSLLRRAGKDFRLRNQTLSDLFMARYAAKMIGDDSCTNLNERVQLFESNEVAGFLVGLKPGQRCLAAVVGALCQYGGYAQHNFEQLDQGLPNGAARFELLERAQTTKGGSLCVSSTIDRLLKAAKGVTDKAPADAPAPEAPGQ